MKFILILVFLVTILFAAFLFVPDNYFSQNQKNETKITREKLLPDFPIKSLTVNNTVWEYIVSGNDDKTLVILPGGGQSAQSTYDLIDAFNDNYQVITITIYQAKSIQDVDDAINAILDKEKASDKISLYGLSFGGMIAQVYARDYSNKIESLILSHTLTPTAKSYREKIIQPLKIIKSIMPLLTDVGIRRFSIFRANIQGGSKTQTENYQASLSDKNKAIIKALYEEYMANYYNKTQLKTWIDLHLDYYNYRFKPEDFNNLSNYVLILRTDNDPLAQDEGVFEKLYPQAQVYTFSGTGHLTFQYKAQEIIDVMKDFLRKLNAKIN